MICAVLIQQRKCTFVHLHCCTVYTQNICLSRVSEDNSNWPAHAIVPNTFFPLELVAPQVQSKPISQSVDLSPQLLSTLADATLQDAALVTYRLNRREVTSPQVYFDI